MFDKVYLTIIGMLLALFLISGWFLKYYYDTNTELNLTIESLEESIVKYEDNLENANLQIQEERELRIQAQNALIKLNEIDDEIYNQTLPPSISDIIRSFNNSVQ
jgi:hypothetical protein